jgi:hypothetical protein
MLKDINRILEDTYKYLMVLVTTEVIIPTVPSYWQYTRKILKDIDKILEDTVFKGTNNYQSYSTDYFKLLTKILEDTDKYLKILTKYSMNLSCAWRLYQATGNTQMTWRARTQDPELEKKNKKNCLDGAGDSRSPKEQRAKIVCTRPLALSA